MKYRCVVAATMAIAIGPRTGVAQFEDAIPADNDASAEPALDIDHDSDCHWWVSPP